MVYLIRSQAFLRFKPLEHRASIRKAINKLIQLREELKGQFNLEIPFYWS